MLVWLGILLPRECCYTEQGRDEEYNFVDRKLIMLFKCDSVIMSDSSLNNAIDWVLILFR